MRHDADHVTTKTDQRAKNRRQEKQDRWARKANPAWIRRNEAKKQAKQATMAARELRELRQNRGPTRILASAITQFVEKNDGEIRGPSLKTIYAMLALHFLEDDSRESLVLIETAVLYACGRQWLRQKEANDIDNRFSYSIPRLTPDIAA